MKSPPQATPSSAVRVLSRTPPPSPTSAPAASPTHDGVVSVGFVGGAGTARLADRILDAHVFSPGGSSRSITGGVRYHRDGEKKMVFLHIAPPPPLLEPGGDSAGDDLRELLFMFSHAFAPFARSLAPPAISSKASPSDTQSRPTHRTSSISPPARRGYTGRQPSTISLMSGTGSHPSLLPGQCIPVVLFVFEDDFTDGPSAAATLDDMGDTSSSNQSSTADGLPKSNSKGSGSVVMLARPVNRSDGSLSKKLHSSLEGQIRFLLKKCRILTGMESGHIGSRSAGNVGHLPLFSLDTSRVVALLDRSINKTREPLDIIAGLFEDSLSSNASLDIPSLQNNCQPTHHEDVQLIKDFILRQSDGLRGRGGYPGNATAGSVAGVGMVAAAAAAAAASASASAGKPVSAPELPSFDKWLSISTSILSTLISRGDGISSSNNNKGSSTKKSSNLKDGQLPSAGSNALDSALSCLERNKGLNSRFSSSWCQRVLPTAKEVYLKDLPASYPTSMHEAQLQKALQSFRSMVKGPAVQVFSKKLEDECQKIWESGRQQCDAVSLTGRPCKHQRHGQFSSSDAVEQHSSGYVFLHACACGRSRRLRDDPFNFEAANVSFNCFSNCEDLLPTLVIPRGANAGSTPPSPWRLVRLGGARYYKPTKGLLQDGFCSKHRHLLRLTISLGLGQVKNGGCANTKSSSMTSNMDPQTPSFFPIDVKSATTQSTPQMKFGKLENSRKQPDLKSMSNSGINFGKGLPNFTMKKPFAEVVAGTTTKDSEFPALQHKRPPKPGSQKDERQVSVAEQTNGRGHAAVGQGPIAENESEKVSRTKNSESADGKPFIQIGSNIVPVIVGNEPKETSQAIQQFVVYVGFEHECSYGHRFLLSEKHLKEIDSSCLQYESPYQNNGVENKHDSQKLLQNASRLTTTAMDVYSEQRNDRLMESSGRNNQQQLLQPRVDSESLQPVHFLSGPRSDKKGEHPRCQFITLDDGGEAFSLLNRNLPIYMHCPHCKNSDRKGHQDVKFAGAVSQLQRIFIVTPDFPVLLASCPLIHFEGSCLPSNVSDHDQQGLFSLGCRVLLPPESFLTMRLPFVYGVETTDGNIFPLKHFEQRPELTAWLVGGTTLQIESAEHVTDKEATVL